MPAVISRPRVDATRKRRTHAKSKKGCGNCKMRRVKCDEAQPSCRKCKLFGVSCNYARLETSLDLDAQGSFQVDLSSVTAQELYHPEVAEVELIPLPQGMSVDKWLPPLDRLSNHSSLAVHVNESLRFDILGSSWSYRSWHFSEDQLQIISRFRERTSVTIGNPQMAPLYRDLVCRLACKHAFLMHMLLSITLMHDAHLENPLAAATDTKTSQVALQHWNTASKLFNGILSQPIPPGYRDAIWATGVFLGAASFWSISSTDPFKVWPLKPEEPDDLSWLRVGEGKKHLWRLAEPKRQDSIFFELVKDQNCLTIPEWAAISSELEMTDRILKIFDITASSTETNNIYYHPVLTLSKCPNVKLTQENALKFLYIMAVITPEFLALLEVKDMRAVFILGWWYVLLASGDLWWMSRRARVEGQAIRIWLRRQRGGDELAELLDEIEKHTRLEESPATWFFEHG